MIERIMIDEKNIDVTEKSEAIQYDYVNVIFDYVKEQFPPCEEISIPLIDYKGELYLEEAIDETIEASMEDGVELKNMKCLVFETLDNRHGIMVYDTKMYDYQGVN